MVLTCFVALGFLQNWNDNIPTFLAVYLFEFLIYGISVKLALQKRFDTIPRVSLFIILIAVAARLTVLPTEPSLSEDLYRYIWDGRAQVAGFNPYDYPPSAPEIRALRDENYPKMKFTELRTLYPPAVQNLFHLIARISTGVYVFKFAIFLFDVLLIEVIRRLLRKEGLSPSLLLIYAWHPLPIVEFSGSSHLDVIALSFMMTAYLLVSGSRNMFGGITFSLAVLTKYFPLLALPWMFQKGGWKFLVFFAITSLCLVAQFYTPDLLMFDMAFTFYKKWWFNDSLFGIFSVWFGGAEPARIWGFFFVCLSAILCLSARYSFYRSFFVIYGAVILFGPAVHPWYVCWMIPFLVFHPSRPWIFFTGWVALSYLIRFLYPTGVWKPVLWLKLLVYLPFYFLLLTSLFRPAPKQEAVMRAKA